jgi:fructosamine-3-kinase
MTRVFTKSQPGATPDFYSAEARGLEFLRVPGGPPLPAVEDVDDERIVTEWIEPGRPAEPAAREFGRRLAVMHTTQPPGFGAEADGFVGPLPLDNTSSDDWSTFYAERRLRPYLPGLGSDVSRAVERVIADLPVLAGPPEPPARIHGDLWNGNLLWAADGQVWLVDAASAHGGHRETDLAMLALFGAPYLDAVVSSYQEIAPLSAGWQERISLHQLHPLLVHAQLFGGHYVGSVIHGAEALVRRSTGGR